MTISPLILARRILPGPRWLARPPIRGPRAPSGRIRRLATILALLAPIVAAASTSTAAVAETSPRALSLPDRPTTLVAMGDSMASGEGGGEYDPATDRFLAWCHRSPHAVVAQAALTGIEQTINLGCSGIGTEGVRLGGQKWYGETPQADQLRTVAREHRVKVITLTIGSNDVPFAALAAHCTLMYYLPGLNCRDLWATLLPKRLTDIEPRIVRVLTDIRKVMDEAGYADDDYELIMQDYVSAVARQSRYPYWAKAFHGCPIRDEDGVWGNDQAIKQLNGALIKAARRVPGTRMLDLSTAFLGREPCAQGITTDQEWVNGIYLSLDQLRSGPGPQVFQQALHPNAAGYAQLARCLHQFYQLGVAEGHCERTSDGVLRAQPNLSPPLR